jgi:hypothetical protein
VSAAAGSQALTLTGPSVAQQAAPSVCGAQAAVTDHSAPSPRPEDDQPTLRGRGRPLGVPYTHQTGGAFAARRAQPSAWSWRKQGHSEGLGATGALSLVRCIPLHAAPQQQARELTVAATVDRRQAPGVTALTDCGCGSQSRGGSGRVAGCCSCDCGQQPRACLSGRSKHVHGRLAHLGHAPAGTSSRDAHTRTHTLSTHTRTRMPHRRRPPCTQQGRQQQPLSL